MPRKPNPVPVYRHHQASNSAYARWTDSQGEHDVYLGPWESEKSKAAYSRILAEVAAGRLVEPLKGISINELALAFLKHAMEYYRRPDKSMTNEVSNYRQAIRALVNEHGHMLVSEFGPRSLKAVRQSMIDRGLARKNINAQVGRIRRIFKWGVSEELVPPTVMEGLRSVAGLQLGRSAAAERDPVEPVPDDDILRTLPYLSPIVAAMVRVQRLTGARPGEICSMRAELIDRSQAVWVYRPAHHKMAYRNRTRSIWIGPQAQEILMPFLKPSGYLFSPAEELALRSQARAAARKTKFYFSRERARPRPPASDRPRRPKESYTSTSYNRAVHRACVAAGVTPWSVNRLRHSFASDVRRRFGLEAAQVLLGHSAADVTQIYAQRDETAAARVAGEIG